MPLGKKICPNCNTEIGARAYTCKECGFDFSAAKLKREEERYDRLKREKEEREMTPVGEKMSPEVARLMQEAKPYEAPKKLTPKDHAERILGYGKDKAEALYRLAKAHHYWSHVNWDVVEQGI